MVKWKKYLLMFAVLLVSLIAFFVPSENTSVYASEVSESDEKFVVLFDYNMNDLTSNIDASFRNIPNYRYEVNAGDVVTRSLTTTDAPKLAYILGGYSLSWKVNGLEIISDEGVSSFTINENTTFKAIWTAKEFTIRFDYADSIDYPATRANPPTTSDEPLKYTIEMQDDFNISYRYKLTRDNYYFVGWFKENREYLYLKAGSVGSFTLRARWSLIPYGINYHTGGDNTKNPNTYTIEDEEIVLSTPTWKGHIFCGWYSDKKFTNQVTTLDTSLAKEIDLYPKWELETYKVTYILPDGSRTQVFCKYGETADLPSELEKNIFQVVKSDVSRKNIQGDTRITISLINIWWAYALGLPLIGGIVAIIILLKRKRNKKFNILRRTYQSNSSKYRGRSHR